MKYNNKQYKFVQTKEDTIYIYHLKKYHTIMLQYISISTDKKCLIGVNINIVYPDQV